MSKSPWIMRMPLKFCLIVLAQAILLLSFSGHAQAANVVDTKAVLAKGTQLIKAKQYNEAVQLFSDAAARKPKNSVLQYYLGMACIYANRGREAELALSKAIALSDNNSSMNKRALDLVYKYRRIKPYSCLWQYLKPPQMVRWDRRKMPLLIYVSDGNMIPKLFDDAVLDSNEALQIGKWAKDPSFIRRLPVSSWFKPAHKTAVLEGLKSWKWAESEKLLSFRFTDNPGKADILVFWCEKLRGYEGWTYHPPLVQGESYPSIFFMNLEHSKGSDKKFYCDEMTEISTHEFGHAVGLEHSPNKGDLMYKSGGPTFTGGDKATVRALYSLTPDITFPSVSRQ